MSVECLTWAFKQKVPAKPKVILLALADQAESETGKVCYGPTNLDHLAKKSSLPRRTLTRHLGALVRNGYLRRESNKDRGQPSHLWLCIDREPSERLDEWKFTKSRDDEEYDEDTGGDHENADDDELGDDIQDVEGVGQNGPPSTAPETQISPSQNGPPPGPPNGPGVGHIDGPQESTTTKEPITRVREQKKESGFSKEAQDADRACVVAEKVNKAQNAKYFVIEGSDAWKYWSAEMARRTGLRGWNLTCEGSVNGRRCRGWYFPSLYPPAPKPTSPPGELSDADAREFERT